MDLETLAAIADGSGEAFVSCGGSGTIRRWSAGAEQLFGFSADEALGKTMALLDPGDRPSARRLLGDEFDLVRGVQPFRARLRAKGGAVLEVEGVEFEEKDGQGRSAGVGRILRAAKAASVRTTPDGEDARVHAVFENLSEGVVIADLKGRILYWNPAAMRMHEYPHPDVPEFSDFLSTFEVRTLRGEAVPEEQWPLRRLLRGEPVRDMEVRVHKRGSEWWRVFNYNGAVISARGGEPLVYLAVADVTERSRAEAAVRESEERVRQLFRLTPVPLCISSPAGDIVYVNERFSQVIGYTGQDAATLDAMWRLVFPSDHEREEIRRRWGAAVEAGRSRGGEIAPGEYRVTCRGGKKRDFLVSGLLTAERLISVFFDVTERNEVTARLKEQEAQLRETSEIACVGGWRLDVEPWSLAWTDELFRIHDLDPVPVLAPEFGTSFCLPADRERLRTAIYASLRDGSSFDLELQIRTAKGVPKWVRTLAHPILAGGRVAQLRGTVQDITAVKQIELERERAGRRVALLADATGRLLTSDAPQELIGDIFLQLMHEIGADAYVEHRMDATQTQLVVARTHGLTPEQDKSVRSEPEVPGMPDFVARSRGPVLIPDVSLVRIPAAARLVEMEVKSFVGYALVAGTRLIGTVCFGSRTPGHFGDSDARLLRALADQAAAALERDRLLRELRESGERFREVVEAIDEVFWVTTGDQGQVLYASPAFEKIWGRPVESVLAKRTTWIDSIHPDDRERVVRALQDRQQVTDASVSYRIRRPDGEVRWINDRSFSIRDASGKICRVVGVAADITQARHLEEQIRHAQKLEAIGTLAGGIAHDFNNILGAIIGFTELARIEAPAAEDHLGGILKACRRATDLVRQILAFSRQQEQNRQPIRLAPVVQEAAKLLRAALPSSVEFDLSVDDAAPTVLADATQIHQVLLNLGANAAHAMLGRPGRLGIRLQSFEAAEEFVQANPGSEKGRYAVITVSDNGQGMSPSVLEHIFEPFFTTKATGAGTGLGLAVVHGIVQGHGGLITVQSEVGVGSAFHLYLPAHDGAAAEPAPPVGPAPQGRGQSILVVDDDPAIAQMTMRMLRRLGYEAHACTDPISALEIVRGEPARFDLLITDLTMPRMTGLEFARAVLAVRPELPILLMTGYSASMTAEQFRAIGIREVVLKPLTLRELAETVEHTLLPKPLP